MSSTLEKAGNAREAFLGMIRFSGEDKERALLEIAGRIDAGRRGILEANAKDLQAAGESGLSDVLAARLKLSEAKIDGIVESLKSVASLEDPAGKTLSATRLDEGLNLYKVTVPIGVIGVVFESRPDVVAQVGGLCLKSGNAVLMKGGSEALHSNRIIAGIMREGLEAAGFPADAIQLIESREEVSEMLGLDDYISLMIPRGSNAFVKYVQDNTNIPVLGHADGICHMYVHEGAEREMAVSLTVDAKTQYPAVCNAIETLLIDEVAAEKMLSGIADALTGKGVELRGCGRAREIIGCVEAAEEDWVTEYNDLILSIKVVDGVEDAVDHINRYGSGHTDAIVTEDADAATEFMERVDSSTVMHNASTRFADGFRYGLGAEVGISTGKIHARGPVGLEGLVTYNYRLMGEGQKVEDYCGEGARKFLHEKINETWKTG